MRRDTENERRPIPKSISLGIVKSTQTNKNCFHKFCFSARSGVPSNSVALFIEPLPYFSRRIGVAFRYDLSGILRLKASCSLGCR